MKHKHCNRCRTTKPVSEFGDDKYQKDGLQYRCKACKKIKNDANNHSRDGLIAVIYRSQRYNSTKRCHPLPDYSLIELREWVYSQPNFNELYKNWVDSGYMKNLVPSCDRLDDYMPYTLGNLLRICTWYENNNRGCLDRKNGVNNKTNKAVIQLTLDGETINRFYSMIQAERMIGVCSQSISRCCNGKRKTAGGFAWCFA